VQDRYGSADAWVVTHVDRPEIGPREVLVAVRAAGVDRGTWHMLTGRPYLLRVVGFGLRRPKNRIAGLDVAGVVVEVGAEVTRFAAGDEVYGICRGAYAELAVAREDKRARKPAGCTFEEAAVLSVSGLAALQALRDAGRVQCTRSPGAAAARSRRRGSYGSAPSRSALPPTPLPSAPVSGAAATVLAALRQRPGGVTAGKGLVESVGLRHGTPAAAGVLEHVSSLDTLLRAAVASAVERVGTGAFRLAT